MRGYAVYYKGESMYLKKEKSVHRIKENEIMYIQQEGRNIAFVTDKGTFYMKCKKIKEIEKVFGDSFIKCHSYLLVNIDKIAIVKEMEIILDGNLVVGMCKAATTRVRKRLLTENNKIMNEAL